MVEADHRKRESLSLLIQQTEDLGCVHAYLGAGDVLPHIEAHMPDILLVDIDTPDRSGIENLAVIKAVHPSLILLALTMGDDKAAVLDALRSGASGCLLKNGPKAEIISGIRNAYLGGSPLPATIVRQMLPLLHRNKPPARRALTLSPREEKILKLLAEGLHYKEIAATLLVSPSTVRAHLHNVYNKMNVQSRAEALAKYLKLCAR